MSGEISKRTFLKKIKKKPDNLFEEIKHTHTITHPNVHIEDFDELPTQTPFVHSTLGQPAEVCASDTEHQQILQQRDQREQQIQLQV